MKKTSKQILYVGVLSLLTSFLSISCASKKIRESGFQKAQWETKAVIKNKKTGGINSVKIDIMAIKDDRARFEISALFGLPMASLVMSQKEISFAYYPKKEFYYGKNSDKALKQLIDIPLHPMNLTYVAFDEAIRGPGWVCQADGQGLISNCTQKDRQIHVQWLNRNGGQKKILITSPEIEMNWFFEAPQTSVQFKANTFTLSQPEGFKAIQIY